MQWRMSSFIQMPEVRNYDCKKKQHWSSQINYFKLHSAPWKSPFKCKLRNGFHNSLISLNVSKSKIETSDSETALIWKEESTSFHITQSFYQNFSGVSATVLANNLREKKELSAALLSTVNIFIENATN